MAYCFPHRLCRLPQFGFAQIVIAMALTVSLVTPRTTLAQTAGQPPPRWVLQSRVQLALGGDSRFKDVTATVTTPGTVVLEGNVFDNKARDAAGQAVSSVEGVRRLINALTTTSLDWKFVQNRLNQSLLAAGLTRVTATVIGNQVFLDGVVSSDAAKQQAVTIVQSSDPDFKIGSNIIRVVPSGL
ncbi:MAG: BON domain-containing protein [Candidatus Binataceae bacterium]|jgi:osmotically-inducible protein OsmY